MAELFSISSDALLVILAMALMTAIMRFSGFILARYLPQNAAISQILEQIPAIVLMSLIAPAVVSAGWQGWCAAFVAAILAWRPGGLLPAMLGGAVTIALLRAAFGAG